MALKRRAASLETLLSNNMQNDNDILQQQFLTMKHQQFTSMILRAQNHRQHKWQCRIRQACILTSLFMNHLLSKVDHRSKIRTGVEMVLNWC